MTQEEKAKAYDKVREKIKVRFGTNVAEEIFSEFEETEDERISKEIIKYLEQTVPHHHRDEVLKSKEWTAWLEKQKPIILTGDDLSTLKNWVGYIQDKASELELNDWFVEATEKVVNKMKTLLIQHPNIIPKEMDVDDTNFWLEKQGEQEQTMDYPDSLPKDNWEIVHEFVEKFGRIPKDEDELNALVEYVLKRQKSIWGKEDEEIYSRICYLIHAAAFENYDVDDVGKELGEYAKITNWLKAIKTRCTWKPSDEQIQAVRLVRVFVTDDFSENPTLSDILLELEEQLKKVKGE